MNHLVLEPEVLAAWMTAPEALEHVAAALGKEGIAAQVIYKRLRDGLIRAAAMKGVIVGDSGEKRMESVLIPRKDWDCLQGSAYGQDFWISGDVELWADGGNTRISYYRLRFDPSGFEEWNAVDVVEEDDSSNSDTQPSAQTKSEPTNKVGAPRKDYWDELWIEMCRQIFNGKLDLTEIKISKIANAMMDWSSLTYPNDALSESAAKRAARRLAEALKRGS